MYVNSGSAENQGTLSFTKEGIIAMYARAGTAINNKIINVSGANSIAMQGEGDAQLTNNANIVYHLESSQNNTNIINLPIISSNNIYIVYKKE